MEQVERIANLLADITCKHRDEPLVYCDGSSLRDRVRMGLRQRPLYVHPDCAATALLSHLTVLPGLLEQADAEIDRWADGCRT